MKYKFCSIHINVITYDVTIVTKGGLIPNPPLTVPYTVPNNYATVAYDLLSVSQN